MRHIPVYVTRKNKEVGQGWITMPAWSFGLTAYLVWFNVVGWGIAGVVELVGKVF